MLLWEIFVNSWTSLINLVFSRSLMIFNCINSENCLPFCLPLEVHVRASFICSYMFVSFFSSEIFVHICLYHFSLAKFGVSLSAILWCSLVQDSIYTFLYEAPRYSYYPHPQSWVSVCRDSSEYYNDIFDINPYQYRLKLKPHFLIMNWKPILHFGMKQHIL